MIHSSHDFTKSRDKLNTLHFNLKRTYRHQAIKDNDFVHVTKMTLSEKLKKDISSIS